MTGDIPEHSAVGPDHQLPSYTPDNHRHKRSRAIIWIFLALLVVLALIFILYRHNEAEKKAAAAAARPAPGIAITSATVQKGSIGIYLDSIGTVTPVYTVSVTSQVNGQVLAVHFTEGQRVQKGDALIDIDPRTYEATLMQAQGALERDQNVLAQAQMDLERYQAAWARNAIAKQVLDDQAKLVLQDQGTVKNDQGTVAFDQVEVEYCHITAPIAGVVGLRLVDPGNVVQAGGTQTLAVITQLEPITVIFTIPEDSLGPVQTRLRKGAKLPVQAFDRTDQTKIASGILLTLDNQIDTTTGTVKGRAQFDNKNDALFPNQFVNTRLLVNTLQGVTLVPSSAIQQNGQASFVFVIQNDVAHMRSVKPGVTDSDNTQVDGINPGDVVANSSFDKLQDNTKVEISNKPAGGNASGGSAAVGGVRRRRQREREQQRMNPSRPFILRPVATALLMAAVLLVGLVGYTQLPVSALPEVDYPTIQVVTFYPGASPVVMATTVTAPLERQFGELQGLSQMTSTSSGGTSVIVLQFNLTLAIDVAEEEVQAAINASQSLLPSVLPSPPVYSKTNPADAPVLTLAITSTSIPLSQVEDLVDTRLAPKISQLNGVGLVTISGGQKPAVRIQANPTALSSYGINLEDLRTALTQASVNAAKGNFDGPRQDYQIDSNDQLVTSADYRKVVVAYRNGAPVMLTDVADIVNGVENNNQAAWMNLTPAVILNVQRQPGANTINVVKSIKSLLPQLEVNLPTGIQVTTLTDLTTAIQASVADVEFELMLTIGLVVLVIFLFLRSFYATIIPSVAVPLSLVGTFGAMYALGYSLDNLSLMALTISTGFVVDDAIVMIENISRYIEMGDPPMEAALKGAEQIGFTILSLTVSLIAVLIPLLFMGDVVGRLFREFAVALAVTIIISAFVSLTLTPMMAARILRHNPESEQGRVYRASERAFEKMIEFYGRTLKFVLGYQTITLLVALGTLTLTIFLYIIIPKGFFPVQDTGVIQGISQAPQVIGSKAMAAKQLEMTKAVLGDPAVESVSSFIGADGTNTTTNSGRLSINLKPLNQRNISASDVIRRLKPRLDQVQGMQLFMEPVQNITVDDRVSRTQYQYTLEDPDANELNDWTNRFVAELKKLPELEDVATDQQLGGLAVSLTIDRITASRLGIAPATIDNTLYDAFGQRQINTMYTQVNQYHVILESQPQFQLDPNKLNHLYIQNNASAGATGAGASSSFASSGSSSAGSNALTGTALFTPSANTLTAPGNALTPSPSSTPNTGAISAGVTSSAQSSAVPLSALLHFENTTEALSINHQGQFPAITVSFNLASNAALGNAITAINRVQQDMHMPASLQADFQGTAASFRDSLSSEPLLILAALVTVYIVLGVLYESFVHPITILSTLPSAGVGAFLALILFHQDLSVVAIIGIVLLIGIVKKNGIMIVDFALDAERNHGKSAPDAIYQACLLRFRPIMMTTMAALLAGCRWRWDPGLVRSCAGRWESQW